MKRVNLYFCITNFALVFLFIYRFIQNLYENLYEKSMYVYT